MLIRFSGVLLLSAWFCIGTLNAQVRQVLPNGPYLKSSEIGRQSQIMQIREFQDSTLFEYWGDCPELLMEYGFKRLIFEDVFLNMNLYHIELAEMADSVAAFGAYSVASRAEGIRDSFYEYSFLSTREALFVKGNWYVRIHTLKPDTLKGKEMLAPLASMLISKIEGNPYAPPMVLTAGPLRQFRSELKLVRGYLGLYYGFPSWIELFRDIHYNEIAVLPLVKPDGWLNYARISFSDEAELEKFQKRNKFYDKANPGYKKREQGMTYWTFLRTGEKTALLMESQGNNPLFDVVKEKIESVGEKK